MNIIAIALKEMKSDLRDKRAFIFMILFPLALVLILGTALSQAFNNDMTIDDSYVLYKMDTSKENMLPLSSLLQKQKNLAFTLKR